jgi:2-hydroxy-3-keto-5-methylthiopentenyl-1-phosphate phosphatase
MSAPFHSTPLTMQDLIKQITDKFGLDASKAGDIVQHVLDFLKDKLPEGVSGLLTNLTGEGGSGDLVDKAKDLLGGLIK